MAVEYRVVCWRRFRYPLLTDWILSDFMIIVQGGAKLKKVETVDKSVVKGAGGVVDTKAGGGGGSSGSSNGGGGGAGAGVASQLSAMMGGGGAAPKV